MKYENAYSEYLAYLSDKAEEIKSRMVVEDVEPNEGMHIVFGEVIVPLVIEWVQANDPAAKKTLEFVEELASSKDKLTGELLDFTILESFADQEPTTYDAIKKLAGPKTLYRLETIEEYLPSA